MENKKETENNIEPKLLRYKSYSIDEIMSAGGPSAFANKMGKNPGVISTKLRALRNDAFLSDEEVQKALDQLREDR